MPCYAWYALCYAMRQNTVLRIDVGCVVKSAKMVYTLQQTIAGRNFNTIKRRKSQKTDYKLGEIERERKVKRSNIICI